MNWFPAQARYYVTLSQTGAMAPGSGLPRMAYEHPTYTRDSHTPQRSAG